MTRCKVETRSSRTGSTWDADKKILLTSYNGIGRSVVSYAAAVWSSNSSATQGVEYPHVPECCPGNCDRVPPHDSMDHPHKEAKVFPARHSNRMLSLQFMLGCYRGSYPNPYMVDNTPPPRRFRKDMHDLEREV